MRNALWQLGTTRGPPTKDMTPDRLNAIGRWLRIRMHQSKRTGYCARETSLYLTDLLSGLNVSVTLDVWIEKSFLLAEVQVLYKSEKKTVSVSLSTTRL